MFFFISILILIFPFELMTNTICSSNETILVSDTHFKLKNQNNFELIEQYQPFTYLNIINQELQDYNLTLVTRIQNQDKFLFVYQNNHYIHIRVCMLHFQVFYDTITNYTFQIENEISIQPNGTFLNAYFYKNYLYLLYDVNPNEYLIQIINHNTNIVIDQKEIRKQKNCIYNIEENSYHYFYFAQFNCSDWVVQLYLINTLELYKNIQFDYFQQILRLIQFNKLNEILQITFDNNVYSYKPDIDYFEQIFVYQDRNIFYYDQQFHILSTTSTKEDQQKISHKAIIRKERPKKILHFSIDLLFLFDSYIELVKNTDLSFNSTIYLDDIFIFKQTYPYIYGIKNNQIILIRGNQMNPLFNCIGNKSQNSMFYKDYNTKEYEWVFTTKKMEIKNEYILFFNIFENIFQEMIPILVQEIKQDYLEFKIFLDQFMLGGPFDILEAQFNQQNIILQEDMQSSICKLLDFSKILWWVIFIYKQDQESVILFQDNNLFLNVIDCDLQIQKKLFKLGKIEKNQIYQKNNVIIIQQNKQKLFLFELKQNLLYKTQQFSFKKDIILIQPINGYFYVYLQDWDLYMIHALNYESKFSVLQFQRELKTQIIFCKEISTQERFIALESQLLLQSLYFQHFIQISNFYNIIEGIQKTKEFVIIHKSNIQDQIKITLIKYYLHNFQFIFMFELPKPSQLYEYIWPICINENNQFFTIAVKEIITNHTFVLIYEISQSYSKILKEIIQVDCCECLQLKTFGIIYYQFQNKIFKKSIEFIKFKVQVQQIKQLQIQSNNISIKLKSKINNKIIEGVQISLISFSQSEGLMIKKNQNLILNKFETIVFDPRTIIFGCIQNITSSSIIITPALKLIAQTIFKEKSPDDFYSAQYDIVKIIQRLNTTKFDEIECCQEIHNPNETAILLEENGDHTFIIKATRDLLDIQIFNSRYILEYQFNIEPGLCNIIRSIISIDNYYFLICQDLILLYKVNSNQIQYLNQITHQYIECTIEKVLNKPFLYLVYDKKSTQQQCILIEIYESNQINTIIFIFNLDKQLNPLSELFFKIIFKNIEFYEDNYRIYQLSMTMFYFKKNLYAQLFKLIIDINQITTVIHSGIIRYPQNTEIKKLLYINQFIVILFQQSESYGLKLYLYDLNEMDQFQIFDSIQKLEGIIPDIIYHDNQSFILIQKDQNYIIKKYQINQYQFEFTKQESEDYMIRFNNQLNSIEMVITFQQQDSNYQLKLEILFINQLQEIEKLKEKM